MRKCIVLFSLLVLTGQIVTALGVTIHSMATMLLGRLIFGLGGECLVVGQSAFVSAWFHVRAYLRIYGWTDLWTDGLMDVGCGVEGWCW